MAIREINLVDPGVLFSRHMRRHLTFWAGCLMVSLILIGGFYLFQAHAVSRGKSSRGLPQQLYSDLKFKIDEIQRLQAELETLRKRQSTLETVIKKQPFYQVLAKLAATINETTWITQLALKVGAKGDPGIRLKLTGVSGSNDDLGNFISRLSKEPMFKAVVLQYAREGETAQTGKVHFQITCNLN